MSMVEAKTLDTYRRFRPSLTLGFQQDLTNLASMLIDRPQEDCLALLSGSIEAADSRASELESLGLAASDLQPVLRYATALRVLRDLVMQGWGVRQDDEGLILDAPGRAQRRSSNPEDEKVGIREAFAFAREAQLRQPATARFIEAMERRGVERLFSDGQELADRLTSRGVDAVAPVLELIGPDARDENTGILLQEVWRYARHLWSIPYQTTPGRNMFYLIRDEAAENRPLIGIAALGNPVLGLAKRDDALGWSLKGFEERVHSHTDDWRQAIAGHLFRVLETAIGDVYSSDLLPEGVPSEWRKAVEVLSTIERDSAAERLDQIEKAGESKTKEYALIRAAHTAVEHGAADSVDWKTISATALYRRKRASTLSDLLTAHGTLREFGFTGRGGDIAAALQHPKASRAIEIVLRRMKQDVMASSVMELIVCGAVPPYREMLGGKLVAQMMLSGEVVEDFASKYANRVSLIASGLAARPVSRPVSLCAITTSSLYAVGSSQYNRIRIPVGQDSIGYRRIGETDSFGTIHFSPDTVTRLSGIAKLSEFSRVNNLFGEGTSPKLRQIRSGLEDLGLEANNFLRHNSRRLLYVASLCTNLDDVALGLSADPRYVLPSGREGTEILVEQWRGRWLEKRVNRPELVAQVREQRFGFFRLGLEVNRVLPALPLDAQSLRSDVGPVATTDETSFVERLYRNSKSYADRLRGDELDLIHVELEVDAFLKREAEAGKQIIVTGNPGDGKTHLIERLRKHLEEDCGAVVITDANALPNDRILDAWEGCQREARTLVLAINEWPLYVLQRLAAERGFGAVEEALRQVTSAKFYLDSQRPEPPRDNVVVIDLSLRNLLAPEVVEQLLDKLTQDRFYQGLSAQDPALSNRDFLRQAIVRRRLVRLLDLVGSRLGHVTMRELVGYLAFLITGGQPAADRLRAGQDLEGFRYSDLAYQGGKGRLAEAVRSVFDPAKVTHPDVDESLWRGETDEREWLGAAPLGPVRLPEDQREAVFDAVKRRFYFEHERGDELLALLPRDEEDFIGVLRSGHEAKSGLVRQLVLALNRFYEPDCCDDERHSLVLWQSHRYDVKSPLSFIASHDLPYQQLCVAPIVFAEWVSAWLPESQRDRRSFGLVASPPSGDRALLEIDRELYLTLSEAQRGLGRASWSRTAARRITRFVDAIERYVESESEIEDIRIRNVAKDVDEHFAIQRSPARYQL